MDGAGAPEGLAGLGFRYPRAVLLGLVAVVLGGVMAWRASPRGEAPDVRGREFSVEVRWPGADSARLEEGVALPLERALDELDAVAHLSTFVKREAVVVVAELTDGADPVEAVAEARKKVDQVRPWLPGGVEAPVLTEAGSGDLPFAVYGVAGARESQPQALREFARSFEVELRRVPGVAKVEVEGLSERRVEVVLASDVLARYRVDVSQVARALAQRANEIPGGRLTVGRTGFLVSTSVGLTTLDDLKRTVVAMLDGQVPVTVGDLGSVRWGDEEPRCSVRVDGKPGFSVALRMRRGEDLLALTERVARRVDVLRRRLPPGFAVEPLVLRADATRRVVSSFEGLARDGLVLGAGATLLFLGLRGGLVALLTLPVGLGAALLAMAVLGVGYHKVTAFAVAAVTGVGLAVVLHAVAASSAPAPRGALVVATVVAGALVAPVLWVGGALGDYLYDVPLVAAAALLAATAAGAVVAPAAAALVRGRAGLPEAGWARRAYLAGLGALLPWSRALAPVLPLVALAGLSLASAGGRSSDVAFFPPVDRDYVVLTVETPDAFDLAATGRAMERVEALARRDADVACVLACVGQNVPRVHVRVFARTEENFGQLLLRLRDPSAREAVEERLRRAAADLDDARVSVLPIFEGPWRDEPVTFIVAAEERRVAVEVAERLAADLRALPTATAVRRDEDRSLPEVVVELDEAKGKLLGLPGSVVARSVRAAVSGEFACRFRPGRQQEFDVVVLLDRPSGAQVSRLARVALTTATGGRVPLGQVAAVRLAPQLAKRFRRDGSPAVRVRCDPRPVGAAEALVAQVEGRWPDLRLPGARLEVAGAAASRRRAVAALRGATGWALLAGYVLLVGLLDSLVQPLLLGLLLPLPLAGAALALERAGLGGGFATLVASLGLAATTSVLAVLAMAAMAGARESGLAPRTAVAAGAAASLGTVLATCGVAAACLVPMARGSEALWAEFGVATLGGLGGVAVALLVVLPLVRAALEPD